MSDSLITMSGNLLYPRDCKGSDFPDIGPTGAAGESSGSNQLVKQTVNQCAPRSTEDDGPGTPVPGDRSRVIASNFKVTPNKGEGVGQSTVSFKGGVDFSSGQMVPNARDQKY
jgi:hypothetical protein